MNSSLGGAIIVMTPPAIDPGVSPVIVAGPAPTGNGRGHGRRPSAAAPDAPGRKQLHMLALSGLSGRRLSAASLLRREGGDQVTDHVPGPRAPFRIGNASGFYGDRFAAMREMLEGGALDVLTGDYLAELTMLILGRDWLRDPGLGYARTFLRQLEDCLGRALHRRVVIVSNAGGLNPAGLGPAGRARAGRLGLDPKVGYVTGDDLLPRAAELGLAVPGGGQPVAANAYLGGWGIAECLRAGADVVITGRVTDASLTAGPAAAHFGWARDDFDALAGATAAGHVLECGAQATGGNYSFFTEIADLRHPGFPVAEIYPDGSSVITKHPGTGGAVTVGTVTAQLLYEIAGPRYLSPDAVARFDTIALEQEGPDRVRIAEVVGEPPPLTLKVTANLEGGGRNSMTLAITGALVEQKARLAADTVWAGIPAGRASFSETSEDLSGDLSGEGMAFLRLAVRGDDEASVGRAFSGAVVETSLASYPGTFFTSAPTPAQAVARYWPTTVAADEVTPHIACDGAAIDSSPRSHHGEPTLRAEPTSASSSPTPSTPSGSLAAALVTVPLWVLVGGRSGDKGGDANVGLWADSDLVARWLLDTFEVAQFRESLPEAAAFEVSRYPLPNL